MRARLRLPINLSRSFKIRYFFTCEDHFTIPLPLSYLFCLQQKFRFCGNVSELNKQNITWMLGNMKFISHAEQDISLVHFAHSCDILFNVNTRNKCHISAQPCNILYILMFIDYQ